ncbi:MAG TPA: O-methyltransferase [Thermodesulfovibrionales bacterium]|nr:O-methyltransferase [Thermodesulfovibrionales bacterium]
MVKITAPKIQDYLMGLAREDDRRIIEMERIARDRSFPAVDRLVGQLLSLLTRMKKPRLVVELGSGFGYSAYWFARALERGRVVLTDYDEENINYARETFRKAGFARRAEFRVGDAIEIAREYRQIDILFIDIEKHQYFEAIRTLLPNLSRNALVIADNALWYGKVTGKKRDRETQGIKKFNRFMSGHSDFLTTILPLRDGVLVAYKLS